MNTSAFRVSAACLVLIATALQAQPVRAADPPLVVHADAPLRTGDAPTKVTVEVDVRLMPSEAASTGAAPPPPAAIGGAPPRPAATGAAPPPPAVASPPPSGWVVLGVGIATLTFGVLAGALALSEASALRALPGCPSTCPASAQSQINTLSQLEWASDLGIGVGVAAIATGTWVLISHVSQNSPSQSSLRFNVGLGVVRLSGGF